MPQLLKVILLGLLLFGLFVNGIDDPYKVLGVSKSASQDEIKRVYKALALKWHPDKNENSQEAQAKFVEITTAYEILTDDEKRREYERTKYGNQYPMNNRGGFDGFGFNYFFQNVKPIFSSTFSITYDNFDLFVANSNDLWVIEFYTDRCGPCIEHAPVWEQTAKSLSDFVRFGRINADEQGSLLRHFRVRSIPSVIAVLGNGNTHSYSGRFDVQMLSDFVKKLMPSQITQLSNKNDWERFRTTKTNKPKALLFSSHASTISPLYKYVSVKYSHLFDFAQVTGEKLDSDLAPRFGISTRPTIVFFSEDSKSENFRAVPGSFTKNSIIPILEEHKYFGAPELHNENFLHLCGRKSTVLCGITFTKPASAHFTKHLQFLRQLPNSEVKVGWVDASKMQNFLSFFGISFHDKEALHSMLIWDGSKRKYLLIHEEIKSTTLSDWVAKKDTAKFLDIPHDVPSLVELSPDPMFDFSFVSSIFRFIGSNIISILVIGLVLFRMLSK